MGYARVSTDEQTTRLQLDALKAVGCERIFEDKESGALQSRSKLDRALADLRAGDTLVVWKLDRLGRLPQTRPSHCSPSMVWHSTTCSRSHNSPTSVSRAANARNLIWIASPTTRFSMDLADKQQERPKNRAGR